jgi:hypothetical protein
VNACFSGCGVDDGTSPQDAEDHSHSLGRKFLTGLRVLRWPLLLLELVIDIQTCFAGRTLQRNGLCVSSIGLSYRTSALGIGSVRIGRLGRCARHSLHAIRGNKLPMRAGGCRLDIVRRTKLTIRRAAGPRRGTEGAGLLVSGSMPLQQTVDPAGVSTDCPAGLPLAGMEMLVCERQPLGNMAQACAGLHRRLDAAQHLGFCRSVCRVSCHRSPRPCGGRAVLKHHRLASGRFALDWDVANLRRRPEFCWSRLSFELHLVCKEFGGVLDAELLDHPKHMLSKFRLLGERKVRRRFRRTVCQSLGQAAWSICMTWRTVQQGVAGSSLGMLASILMIEPPERNECGASRRKRRRLLSGNPRRHGGSTY